MISPANLYESGASVKSQDIKSPLTASGYFVDFSWTLRPVMPPQGTPRVEGGMSHSGAPAAIHPMTSSSSSGES